jgi:hypothetical protein
MRSVIAAVAFNRTVPESEHRFAPGVKPGKPVTVVEATEPEPTSPPLMVTAGNRGFGTVQVTPVPPRAAKFAAVPREGAEVIARVIAEVFAKVNAEVELSGGALMRDAESLLHAAESSANVTTTPAANLGATSARARRF